jgi:molecular chaperone Hsp33
VLLSLGEEDYEEILKEAETEINCQFCEKKYIFTSDELRKIRENAKKI